MCGKCSCMMPSTGHSGHHHRSFFTKEEKIKKLEAYVEELKKEIRAVEEVISEMSK